MIPENVTLIVKAPNQQIEDQNVECQLSWTVKQLKGHLSEVYPSKPTIKEQKIIYSGQLLDDNAVIKDILRTYDTQFTHTMHLVCAPKRQENRPIDTDGLRRRTVQSTETEAPAENANRPETRQNDQNHTVEMQNYISSFVNNYGRVPPYHANFNFGEYLPATNDPTQLANQMMVMQQAYVHYMQQYANMWQGGVAPGTQPNVPVNDTPVQQPPPPEPPQPAEEPEDARRDWLDHLYAASRLAILFSLVYVYSSPLRLLLVAALAVAGYLHQVGFFHDLAVAANVNGHGHDHAHAHNVDAHVNENVDNVNVNQNVNVNENAPPPANPDTTDVTNNVNNNEENESFLAVTWMIVTTFLSSLVPEMN